jgi:hypothetical protein
VKARQRLGPYSASHRGVDVAAVLAQVTAAEQRLAAGSLELGDVDV